MKDRTIWFGRYEGWLRWLCRGVRDGDGECIKKAAKLFDLMLPHNCLVIPMPGHNGYADQMKKVCIEMGRIWSLQNPEGYAQAWMDALICNPHQPNYLQKKGGGAPAPIEMSMTGEIIGFESVYIIDNVIASGVTASAALESIPEAMVCAIAKA
jgi:hypothetical protein